MSRPKVSIVITAYNRPDYLEEALNSVRKQTYENYEVIVVDDCSETDISGALGAEPGEVRYVRLSENGGPSRARNRGVALAGGDYLAFLDDDDMWAANKLERQVAAMVGHEACLCGITVLERGWSRVHAISEVTGDLLRMGNIFCGSSGLMARRDALLDCPFDENLSSGEDWDAYVRLSKRGAIAYVSEPLVLYRLGSHESITTQARNMLLSDVGVRVEHIHKNRDWLGDSNYRLLLARKILEYIGSKSNKSGFLAYSIRHAGLFATLDVLLKKTLRSPETLGQERGTRKILTKYRGSA